MHRSFNISFFVFIAVIFSINSTSAIGDAETVVFQQDFEGMADGTKLTKLGWDVQATADQSQWEVKDGHIEALFHHNPYKGGMITIDVPQVKKGYLQYDAWIGGANNRHLSLTAALYDISTSYNGYGSWRIVWSRYAHKYINGEKVEGGGWKTLVQRLAPGNWHTFRIMFDTEKNLIEYFAGDMEDPVGWDTRIPILAADSKPRITFRNYGLCSGDVRVRIDNIKLVETRPSAAGAAAARDKIAVINGIQFGIYKIPEALEDLKGCSVKYHLMECGLGITPRVITRLAPLMGSASLERMKLLIMANATAECIEPVSQELLLENVRRGANLLVLGGLFTYGKGQFKGSKLEELVPVVIGDPWNVKRAEKPLALRPAGRAAAFEVLKWDEKPSLLYYHDLEPKKGAEIWLEAEGRPVLVVWKVGRGRVAAFTGAPIGKMPEDVRAFWEWEDWPDFLNRVIREMLDTQRK